jgi:hypothetical protein
MAELKTTCGTAFIVDADISEQVGHLSWKLDKDGYVIRKTTVGGKHGRTIRLHRTVLECSNPAILVDHKDGNKLDNRRDNLRLASKAQNSQNCSKRPNHTSQFRGVTWNRAAGKWQASLKANGQSYYLGLFIDESEAGRAYNQAAIQRHKEFARINPIGVTA